MFPSPFSGLSFMGWELANYSLKQAKEAGELSMGSAAGLLWLPVLSCLMQP